MTEQKWLQSTAPKPMLKFLERKPSERKLRLFAVACCRRISHLIIDPSSQPAVDVAEQFAEGLVSESEVSPIRDEAELAIADEEQGQGSEDAREAAYYSLEPV